MEMDVYERARSVDFHAYASHETMPVIAERINRLLDGRRMAAIRRYTGRPHTERLQAGLTLDLEYGDCYRDEGDKRGFALMFGLGNGVVIWTDRADGDEDAARARWYSDEGPKNVTRVVVRGRGGDWRDQLEVITYNELGVGVEWKIVFDNGH